MAKKVLIGLFVFSVLFLGFSVGRYTNFAPSTRMSQAAKANDEFKKLDEAEQAIALAIAASSPQISKEIIANLSKGNRLPAEAFQKVLGLARAVSSGPQPGQKPPQAQAGDSVDDVLKETVDVKMSAEPFTLGDKDAPVTIVAFTELLCPFCSRVDPVLHDLQKEFGADKVRLVFQTRLIHGERAEFYHRAAFAAGMQGKFWEFVTDLFTTQQEWVRTPIEEAFEKVITPKAEKLGLNVAKLKADMDSDKVKQAIAAENAAGEANGVRGTPTVFINGHMVRGAKPAPFFKEVVEKLLAQHKG